MEPIEPTFTLRSADGSEIDSDPRDHLSPFLPPGERARQINYGQGEGQIEIDGRIWGIYFHGPDAYRATLEEGELALADFCETLDDIRAATERYFGRPIEVRVRGAFTGDLAR